MEANKKEETAGTVLPFPMIVSGETVKMVPHLSAKWKADLMDGKTLGLPFDYYGVPEELAQQKAWIITKITRNPDGTLAKPPAAGYKPKTKSTWITLDEACFEAWLLKEKSGTDVIAIYPAYVTQKGIGVIDLDIHRKGENLVRSQHYAELMTEAAGCYIEESMSGQGWHIIGDCAGTQAFNSTVDGVEIQFKSGEGHYVCLTGRLTDGAKPEIKSILHVISKIKTSNDADYAGSNKNVGKHPDTSVTDADQLVLDALLRDVPKVADCLTGNLRDGTFTNGKGETLSGSDLATYLMKCIIERCADREQAFRVAVNLPAFKWENRSDGKKQYSSPESYLEFIWKNWVNQKAAKTRTELDAQAIPHNLEMARPKIQANTVASIVDELNIGHINVLSPPGLAGEIVVAMRERAHRNLDEIYSAAALSMIAAAARNVMPITGVNSHSIIIMATAPTGGGKGICQAFFNQACVAALGRNPAGKPTSSKQPIEEMVENDGHAIFNVDEAHAMFDQMADSKSAHMRDLETIFLQFATNSSYNFSTRHKKEFLQMVNKELENPALTIQERNILEVRKADIISGFAGKVKLVMLNISTPENFNHIVSDKFLKSGFIGRSIIVTGPTEVRADTNDLFVEHKATMPDELITKFMRLGMMNHQVVIDDDAKALLTEFKAVCNRDEYLNHPKMGCLFVRAVERAMALASIAGIYSGVVTTEEAAWAIRMVLHHIDTCAGLLATNELDNAKSQEEKAEAGGDALMVRLREIIKKEGTIADGRLWQFIARKKALAELVKQNPDVMPHALKQLESEGSISIEAGERKGSKYKWLK